MLKKIFSTLAFTLASQAVSADPCEDSYYFINDIKNSPEIYHEKIRHFTFENHDNIREHNFQDLGNIGFREIEEVEFRVTEHCDVVMYSFKSEIANKISSRRFSFFFDTLSQDLIYTVSDWNGKPFTTLNVSDKDRYVYEWLHQTRSWQGYGDGHKRLKSKTLSFLDYSAYTAKNYDFEVVRQRRKVDESNPKSLHTLSALYLEEGDYIKFYTNKLRSWAYFNIISQMNAGLYQIYVNGEVVSSVSLNGDDNEYPANHSKVTGFLAVHPDKRVNVRDLTSEVIIRKVDSGVGVLYAMSFAHDGG